MGRVVYWVDSLPSVAGYSPRVPAETIRWLGTALNHEKDGEAKTRAGLQAAALIRCWWQELGDQGHRLDPYMNLSGDEYLWSSLKLVNLISEHPLRAGAWNVLRRVEANLRSWWLERITRDEPVAMIDIDEQTPYLSTGTSTYANTPVGWNGNLELRMDGTASGDC